MSYSILVCDDSSVARKQVIRSLKNALEVSITQAANGVEALKLLNTQHIDLVCLDLTMPELDGLGVLKAIKELSMECFVIVISADIQSTMRERVRKLGAIEFIEKPVPAERLINLLHKYGIR